MRIQLSGALLHGALAGLLVLAGGSFALAHGGFGGGGFGAFHGGFGRPIAFSHTPVLAGGGMARSGFGHMGFAHATSFGHGPLGHAAYARASALRRTSYSHFSHSMFHRRGLRSTALRHGSHLARLHSHHATPVRVASRSGLPGGFDHGNASWKQNGGTPPGWSRGNKTGWHCAPGSAGCMPPGLSKTGNNGLRAASHAQPIPLARPNPAIRAASRNANLRASSLQPVSRRARPDSHTMTPQLAARSPTAVAPSSSALTRAPRMATRPPTDLTRVPVSAARSSTAPSRLKTEPVAAHRARPSTQPIPRPAPE